MTRDAAAPYVGLRPFTMDETAWFAGRNDESVRLRRQLQASRLLVVYGPAGVGKTSLIQAGLLPQLADLRIEGLPPVPLRRPALPQSGPEVDNPFTRQLLSEWSDRLVDAGPPPVNVTQFMQRLPPTPDPYDDEAVLTVVAILDQFEEVFRDRSWATARDELLADLTAAMDSVPHLCLLISMREEALGAFLPYEPDLAGSGPAQRVRVSPLALEDAVEAVTFPAKATARALAKRTARDLVRRLTTSTINNEVGEVRTVTTDVEPMSLQILCLECWRGQSDRVAYDGDLEATLVDYCTHVVTDVAVMTGLDAGRLWLWLDETFTCEAGIRSGVHEGVALTAGLPNEVARGFAAHQILRVERAAELTWFVLQTDVLIAPIRRGRQRAEQAAVTTTGLTEPTLDAYLRMAQAALRSGLLDLAYDYAKAATVRNLDDPTTLAEAHLFLGTVAELRASVANEPDRDDLMADAIDARRRAAELLEQSGRAEDVQQVTVALGRFLRSARRVQEAETEFRRALERDETDTELRLELAHALRDGQQSHAAIEQYSEVVARDPTQSEAFVERAKLTVGHNKKAARQDIAAAEALDPSLRTRLDVIELKRRAIG